MLLTGVDEARKLTIWMMANIGPGEAFRVKYVLNARKSSHSFLVWKRRRRRKRPASASFRSLRAALLIFDSTFFFPLLFFPFSPHLGSLFRSPAAFESETPGANTWRRHLRQNQPRSSLTLLGCCSALGRHPAPSTRRCCAAQRVRLRGLSPRPIPAGAE